MKEKVMLSSMIIAIIVFFTFLIIAMVEEQRKWEKFKVEHNCTKTAHISGTVFNTVGVGSNGQMTIGIGTTPDKDCWSCDDGMTYCR